MDRSRHKLSSSQNKDIELSTRTRGKLKKSGNVKSRDSDPSDEDFKSFKAVDVVVDVHREVESTDLTSQEVEETIVEVLTGNTTNITNKKIQEGRRNNDKVQPRSFASKQEATIDESLNLIEEFNEIEARYEKKSLVSLGDESPSEEAMQAIPRRRKQWRTSQEIEEVKKKPPRKRWSKNASVFRLPETAGSTSSAASSNHESNTSVPVSALKPASKQNSFFDNPAFMSDNDSEDVLRIETNYNDKKNMRIEMKSKKNLIEEGLSQDQMNGDTSDIESLKLKEQNQFKEKIFGDNIETIEMSGDSDRNERSSEENMALISSERRRSVVNEQLKGNVRESETKSDSDVTREDIKEELHGSDISIFRRRSSKDTTLSTNEDLKEHSNENLRDRSCSDRESIPTSSSRKSSKLDRERFRSDKRSRRKVKRTEKVEEVRSESKRSKKKKSKDGKGAKKELKYISVTIHRADMLETDYITKHPMVKVHIVEAETGNYVKNTVGEGSNYLQPIITGKFDFKENKSMIPVWEEGLIFEHDFDVIERTDDKRVVILFEVIDLLSFAEASSNYDTFGNEGCWYKIAWAFLKPVGVNNTNHTDKMVRLQLYRPRRNLKKFGRHKCEVYTWWKSNVRDKYPSSLFVTVTSVEPQKLEPVVCQQLSFNDFSRSILGRNESQRDYTTRTSDAISLPKWTRLTAQSCKIPNHKLFETEISENGYFFVAFSHNGKFLACVNSEEYDYPIVVYEMDTRKINVQFKGHKTFVYSVNWCNDDRNLLSVSSDQTGRIWDVHNRTIQHVQLLPHPSYVYCGKFDPQNSSIVATGCYDRIVRIWSKGRRSASYDLAQECEGHEGFVNSMCFQKEGNLLTGDSVGLIIIWAVKKNRGKPSRKEWQISRKIKVRETEGVTINTIALHPLESRLLVHSRNNGLRMLDLATGVVLQKYKGLNNQRIQSIACISPCGGLILCGGEDSSLNVWSFETGKYLARYTIDRNYRAVTCVDYHPYDHVLAFSTFGSPAPVRLLNFDKDSTGEEVGLKLFTEQNNIPHRNDIAIGMSNESIEFRERSRSNGTTRREDLPDIKDHHLRQVRSLRSGQSIPSNPESAKPRQDLRLKFDRRLDETEKNVKSNSTSRLYHIIERIDRILSNTSRSSDDIESGRNMIFEKKNELEDRYDVASRKSNKSRHADELNLSDDSKIESLRMSKLEIENEMNIKGKRGSTKARRQEKMPRSYLNLESESSQRRRSKNVSEQSSDGTTHSSESKTLHDMQRNKLNVRKISAYSDPSCNSNDGDELEVIPGRRDSTKNGNTYSTDFRTVLKGNEKRSKSAKGWRSEIRKEVVSNAFSDSAANSRRRRQFLESENDSTPRRRRKSVPGQSSDSTTNSIEKGKLRKIKGMYNLSMQNNLHAGGYEIDTQSRDFTKSPESKSLSDTAKKCDSTSTSGGTYVLEKADLETNKDFNPMKVSTNANSSSNEKKKSLTGSETSLKSNATFVLEHERIPVPKPRKKKPS